MKENKYYIPSVDEFHVGFEFERANYGSKLVAGAPVNKEWIKDKLTDSLFDINDILDIYNEGKYSTDLRVKYLDREDIESLGDAVENLFEYDNNGEPIPMRDPGEEGELYDFPLAFNLDTQLVNGLCYILYLYKDHTVWIEWIKDCCGMGYIFKGVLRNKSEFIKILEQLGIRIKKDS